MIWIFALISAFLSYLLGSVNSSIIISKLISGNDIRTEGSGNAGATNMLRTHGKKAGILTLVFDMLKGVAAILLCMLLTFILSKFIQPENYNLLSSVVHPTLFGKIVSDFEVFYVLPSLKYIGALFVVIGHNLPVFFGFKGGKGVATSGAVVLMLDWKVGLIVIAFALLVMVITRYVSLGSIVSGCVYPIVLIAFMLGKNDFDLVYFIFSVLLGGLLVIRHKANIKRLLNGTESKLGQKKSDT